MNVHNEMIADLANRRSFIGGSDARTIMGDDEAALIRLWREKRGEAEPEDLSGNLIVQLGVVTESLNRTQYGADPYRGPKARAASSRALDGRYPRRHGRSYRGGVRG